MPKYIVWECEGSTQCEDGEPCRLAIEDLGLEPVAPEYCPFAVGESNWVRVTPQE